MKKYRALDELISILVQQYPEADFGFLIDTVYFAPLTQKQQVHFLQLIEWARLQQAHDASFEPIYHRLLHLYVLNGSRLESLKLIDRRLRGLANGQNALLLVSGVSGIGKTSLVWAFQERMQSLGLRFISVRCSGQGSVTHGLWQDLAETASAEGMSIEELPAPFGTGPELQSSQQLKQALGTWLAGCASQEPLVILLDDLHWADADSLDVLKYLAAMGVSAPILFIATYRSEEMHTHSAFIDALPELKRNQRVDIIHLAPLNQDATARLVTAYHGPCSAELAAYLAVRAEGHPLFTVELLHDLIAQNLLSLDQNGEWQPPAQSVHVPAFLQQLILQRAKRHGTEVEQLLIVASVVGEIWELKIIEPILEPPESKLLETLEIALKAELVAVEDDKAERYRFSHGLIREVLYSTQLARRRKRLHEQIAMQFEQQQETNVTVIAHHYYEAEVWVKAVEYCLAAGEQSIQRFAFHLGLQWYQQALDAAEHAGNEISPAKHIAMYSRLGRTYLALERRQEAEMAYSRMRDIAQSSNVLVAEGQALVSLTHVRIAQYQFDLAEKTAYEALKIGERTGDIRLLVQIHISLLALSIYQGQLAQSTSHLQEAQALVEKLDDPIMRSEILKFWGYITIWAGRYREAESYSRSLLVHVPNSVDPVVKLSGYQNLGWSQIETGQYHEAYLNFLTVIEMDEMSKGHHHIVPRVLNMMGYLHLELGGTEKALEWDQKALAASLAAQGQGNYEMRRYSLLNIATDYLHLGKLAEVQETIAQFEAITEASESVRFRYFNRYQLLMSELHLTQQKYEQAIELAQEAQNLAASNGILKNIVKSHWLEGQSLAGLRRHDEALAHLEKAISLADEIQHGSLRWKIRLTLASVLRKTGRAPDKTLRQARELMDTIIRSLAGSPLQAIFLDSSWVRLLENLEQNLRPEKVDYPAGLTQREVEILQLVARGATNQQIADVLHISVRTVNTHLTNILNKTGCENRTAASAFAIQHKLVST